MAGRDLHGVTCHQPSPEGLKVPWLEPALLAGSATNSVNSGDRFPPGGKHGAPPPFPNLCQEVPCDGRHAAMIHWSSVETTFTYIYISTPYFILFISRLVFPGHAYRIKLVFQHLLYQNWSWDPHFVVRIPYRHFVGGMFGTYRNLFVGPQNVFSKLEDGVITQWLQNCWLHFVASL